MTPEEKKQFEELKKKAEACNVNPLPNMCPTCGKPYWGYIPYWPQYPYYPQPCLPHYWNQVTC